MNIGSRLEAIGALVPQGSILADIGTDHAYLPVWLLQQGRILRAIAGDIAEGPCLAAGNTVSMYGMKDRVEVRLGSGLKVLQNGEVNCIAIAGMGASTMIDILTEDLPLAQEAETLILQPMAGAPSLRAWLVAHGWSLQAEELVEEGRHLYEIIVAVRGQAKSYTRAEMEIGPLLIAKQHPLLKQQFTKVLTGYKKLLQNMSKSEQAVASAKYADYAQLVQEVEELANDTYHK